MAERERVMKVAGEGSAELAAELPTELPTELAAELANEPAIELPSERPAILVCPSDAVLEGGKGVRFAVRAGGDPGTGFVVRYGGTAYGYLNRCAHVPIELDWAEGEFFESSGLYLMCATHGAVYAPETGLCAGGPCRGGRLRPIGLLERDQQIFWQPDDYVRPCAPPEPVESHEPTEPTEPPTGPHQSPS